MTLNYYIDLAKGYCIADYCADSNSLNTSCSANTDDSKPNDAAVSIYIYIDIFHCFTCFTCNLCLFFFFLKLLFLVDSIPFVY